MFYMTINNDLAKNQVNGFELILQSNEFADEGLRIFLCQQKNELKPLQTL